MIAALRLRRRGRHVLWGGRRGDMQLSRRSAASLMGTREQGLPAGATCIGVERTQDAYWFWIPVT